MWLSILQVRDNTTRLDFVALYYSIAINFLILSYCLHYPKGIDKRLSRFILLICSFDLIHLFLAAKQGFGVVKVGTALMIVLLYEYYKSKKSGVN